MTHRTLMTDDFIIKMFQKYTERVKECEAQVSHTAIALYEVKSQLYEARARIRHLEEMEGMYK